jgi:hypothetical protein
MDVRYRVRAVLIRDLNSGSRPKLGRRLGEVPECVKVCYSHSQYFPAS